ncbi:hypothetical protein I2486_19905 [Cellulophaga sp. E16_2]|uniref:Lipoprotein n=1 Tax=Cellulophaga algicola (strain DSM 14237 / IC166 / ACAM 630) TaxID=688270 RepID=E6XDU7_CELAD|nr:MULTISPECIES: hypothetical protein [Cellulophaga]ADV51285.1 hypothetical protein Celal_4041 [Cellulophaga algicola DSM 14237]MBO0593670.1 hypothetical protein [Cellulophaga sp. E16_2]
MTHYKITIITLLSTLLMTSCLSTEEKKIKAEEEGNAMVSIKSKLIKGAGDALKTDGKEALESASEGIGEAFKGLTTGYDKSINQAKVLSDSIFSKTFEIGRTEKIYSDTTNIKKVTVYLIANQSFDRKIKLKAYDQSKREIGRSTKKITIEEDDALFIDFEFDNRTPLLQADYFIISHN